MRFLLILFVLLSQTLQAQIYTDPWTKDLVTDDIERFVNQYFPPPPYIQPKVYVRAAPLTPRYIATADTIEPGKSYIITFNWIYLEMNHVYLDRTFIHELQHILQFHSNRLSRDEFGFIWEGTRYPYEFPYQWRPWELEADSISDHWCN